MILYGSSLSPYVRKVLAFASEKGIELELGRPGARRGSRATNFCKPVRCGRCRRLRDGDFTLAEFDRDHPLSRGEAARAQPDPARGRRRAGRTIWFDEFADTVLTACGAKMFFNRIVAAAVHGASRAMRKRPSKAEREELPPLLDYLETVVPEPGGFLVGTAHDACGHRDREPVRQPDPPGLRARCRSGMGGCTLTSIRILARPSFAPWIERETAILVESARLKENAALRRWSAAPSLLSPRPQNEPPPRPDPPSSRCRTRLRPRRARRGPAFAKSEPPVAFSEAATAGLRRALIVLQIIVGAAALRTDEAFAL